MLLDTYPVFSHTLEATKVDQHEGTTWASSTRHGKHLRGSPLAVPSRILVDPTNALGPQHNDLQADLTAEIDRLRDQARKLTTVPCADG